MPKNSNDIVKTDSLTRVGFLDEARGLSILLMVAYHAAYDLVYLFGVSFPLFHAPFFAFAQPFFAGLFILISGICCRFSRSNRKRGLLTLGLGLAMSIVTLAVMPDQAIYFGILHFLGTAMLLFSFVEKGLDRLSPAVGIIVSSLLALLTFGVSRGYVGIPGLAMLRIPLSWRMHPFLLPLGLYPAGADYFPLFPWLLVFFAGCYLGVWFAAGAMPSFFYRSRSRFLAFVGRHTLYVYLLHQPVVYALLFVLFRLTGWNQ